MSLVKYNNNSISAVTTTGLAEGDLVPIKTLTASSSSTLSFVDGSNGVVLDSTYPIYKFEFINIHPATNGTFFQFNMSTDSGSNYNVAKTTTAFYAYHTESGSASALTYDTGQDLAQGTGFQNLLYAISSDNDSAGSGEVTIYNPSSTTFVKHFLATSNTAATTPYTINFRYGGYGNTTSAINAIRFQMSSGNIDSGKIKLYGIKDS